jgi:hypothetical protein
MSREYCWRANGTRCECVQCRRSRWDVSERPVTVGRVGPPTQAQRKELAQLLDQERREAGRIEQARREARRLEKQAQAQAWQARQRTKGGNAP